jgi:Mg2+ and Co2+ transporter CorA
MMMAYRVDNDQFQKVDCSAGPSALSEATWIDVLDPTEEQASLAARVLRVNIPTQKEMRVLKVSSQIDRDGDALVMTRGWLVGARVTRFAS